MSSRPLSVLAISVGLVFLSLQSLLAEDAKAPAAPAVSETTTVSVSVADPVTPAPSPSKESAAVPADAAPVAVEAPKEIDDGLVTLDFQDADIRNVLKVLSFKSGLNIVTGPEVAGVVTIQLSNVPWQKALEVILSTYGYGYERKGNIILVTTIENLKKRREENLLLEEQAPMTTKTYVLSFAKAADIVDSISKVKSSRGTINYDQRTNTLIVRDVQNSLDLIDNVVSTLDTVTPQVLIEARIVETTLTNTENLGVDWSIIGSVGGSQHSTTFPFTQETQTFIPSGATVSNNTFKYGTLDASGLTAVMKVLSSRTDTNILSNPKIVTLDNQAAKIVVGKKYPFPQYTYNQEQAKMQVSGWEYKDIGIIFEVTPHVNNAGLVTLDLHPAVTSIVSGAQGSVTVEGTTVPILTVEETQTKVMIANGQTLIIAGLIKDTTTKTNNKVPFLSSIPILGYAFKNKEDQKEKTELLLFLTPHIVTSERPASETAIKK